MKKVWLIIMMALVLLPVWFMVVYSLEDVQGVLRMPPRLIPNTPTIENFRYISNWPLLRWVRNSAIAVVATVILSVIVYAMAGYAFAFKKIPHEKLIWAAFIAGMMVPRMSLMIPMYITIRQVGISGTMAAVVLTSIYQPVNLYLTRNYMMQIPKAIIESATIDGASEWTILYRVIIPLALPVLTLIALLTGIFVLSDYVWQSLIFQFGNTQTLVVGIMKNVLTRGGGELNINPLGRQMAVGVILLFPLLTIFLIANKYFITGISVGGVKE